MVRHAITAIFGLLASLGSTAAVAGRGDLDPGYGTDGRLTAGTVFYDPNIRSASDLVALNMLDDRLITVEGSLVRRFDSEGRPDLTFGSNGEISFALPTATPIITPLLNPVSMPDGGLLLAGYLSDDQGTMHFEALIRLDRNGHLVTSFGGNGDGVYRLSTDGALMAVAVDPTGRVLLAKRGPGFSQYPCSGARFFERLTPDGSVDTTFGENGRSDFTGVDLCSVLFLRARDDGGFLVRGRHVVIAFDVDGAPDTSFGVDGKLALDQAVEWSSGLLLPDGGLMLAGDRLPPSQPGITLAKFNASGQPDVLFGDGTGAVQRDFGEAFFRISGLQHHVSALASTVDGGQLYLQVSLMRSDRGVMCAGGIARLSGDGSIDTSFGQRGLTCLDYGAFPFAFIGLQRDGAPLFGRLDGNVYRLLLDATASPGFLAIARPAKWHDVGEKDGNATLAVVRTAGRDGVVSAHFYTREAPPDTRHTPPSTDHIAGADSDYRTASGRIEWADGEESWQLVSIDILDDLDEEIREVFLVEFDDVQGGTELYGSGQFIVGINDDDSVAIADDDGGAQTDDSPSGGGGSMSWATQLALLTLLFIRRRRIRRAVARIASLPGLLLLVNAAAWAGRGDIDPNYGDGGRVSAISGTLLALPGDRLVIADAATEEGLRVRMVEASGRNVQDFGEGGIVRIDSSAAEGTFWPGAAALAPNGDMIFEGSLHTGARELLRLDNHGQPVVSFGNRGDGFVELALVTIGAMAFGVDPDGKILVAEGSADSGGGCGSPARLQRLLANGQPDPEFGVDGTMEIPNLDLCQGPSVFGARADGSVIIGEGGVVTGEGHTIVAVDPTGDIDLTFGVGGRLAVRELPWARGLLLPDGGLLIFGSNDEAASSNDTVFLKFDRSGQPDLDFGSGTGSVTVDLAAEFLGESSVQEYIGQLVLDPDGEHVIAQLSFSNADGSLVCGGIARLSIDGVPDTSFGRNGLTCLNVNFALIAVQGDGAPLFFGGYWSDSIYRLLPDSIPSPGFLGIVATSVEVGESEDSATVVIERLAGRDGAVSVDYATVDRIVRYYCGYRVCSSGMATASSDYTANSGRLDWASGDESPRTVSVEILDDGEDENGETFGVDFSEPGGGVLLIAENPIIGIGDDDRAATVAPLSASGSNGSNSGGGGSVSWATQLALLTLLFIHRRRTRHAD